MFKVIVFLVLAVSAYGFYGLEEVTFSINDNSEVLQAKGVLTLAYHTSRAIIWLCPSGTLGKALFMIKSSLGCQIKEELVTSSGKKSRSIPIRID